MEDWLSYRLSDLLLFSPRTYYRMFELYHQDIWPGQLVVAALAVVLLVLLRRSEPWRGAAIAGMLAVCWLWVAVAFHAGRYATINPAAWYFAALFVVQAILLAWYGVVRRQLVFARWPSTFARVPVVLLIALALPPVAGRATERSWGQVELVALTPDATAVATIGLLIVVRPPPRTLLIAPLAWCAIAAATLWALESAEAWVPIVAGLVAFVGMVWRSRPATRTPRGSNAGTPSHSR